MTNTSTHPFARAPIGSLYASTAIPVGIALLLSGLYNVVDGVLIARLVSEAAMGAVAMVFPWQMFMAAIATMLSSGMATIVTRQLGKARTDQASNTLGVTLILALLVGLLFAVIAVTHADAILMALQIETIFYADALEYWLPITLFALPSFLLPVLADMFRAQGKPERMMLIVVIASISNIPLTYLCLDTFELGVSGAAYASVIAQCIGLLIGAFLYWRDDSVVAIVYSIKVKSAIAVVALGFPTLVAQLSVAIQTGAMNSALLSYGDESWLIAYGMLGRVAMFVILPLIAMSIAYQTLCAFNLGANLLTRVNHLTKIALGWMLVFGTGVMVLLLVFANPIIALFTDDPHLIERGEAITYALVWGLPITGVSMLATGFYQAKGHAKPAIVLSALRVFVILLPLLYITPQYLDLNGVFIAFVAADYLACILAGLYWRWEVNKRHTERVLARA